MLNLNIINLVTRGSTDIYGTDEKSVMINGYGIQGGVFIRKCEWGTEVNTA